MLHESSKLSKPSLDHPRKVLKTYICVTWHFLKQLLKLHNYRLVLISTVMKNRIITFMLFSLQVRYKTNMVYKKQWNIHDLLIWAPLKVILWKKDDHLVMCRPCPIKIYKEHTVGHSLISWLLQDLNLSFNMTALSHKRHCEATMQAECRKSLSFPGSTIGF